MKKYLYIIIAIVALTMALSACFLFDDLSGVAMIHIEEEVGEYVEKDDNYVHEVLCDNDEYTQDEYYNEVMEYYHRERNTDNEVQIMCNNFKTCSFHANSFHFIDLYVMGGLVSREDYMAWATPLREQRQSPYDCCTVNVLTFIRHFGITEDQVQQVIDNLHPVARYNMALNIDILFSGDDELIEQFYAIENEMLHQQLMNEQVRIAFITTIMELQNVVSNNTRSSGMSRYYHDIKTFSTAMMTTWVLVNWMQEHVAAGRYEYVNIVDAINHLEIPRFALERMINESGIYRYTHYNLDVIFSNNTQLIMDYYSIENEAAHTAQVQAAFDMHVANYGMPDADNR